ncbi:DUF1636 family protein [Fulvimarina sp. 2208YS6-2-32]|uniref:DUF1636 family protein n=1 Tax=Fulvimarina uroteuthidis TaxID=3098149 RepID=A0ABU5I4I8_9HYPH|nr:DUF1636 family protein [Fulvimarina sp. 2208YS6-2-32]MDY8110294.1 DUF1636 family protein [Fulvimarina sp. 2208YS6-2-32]
MTAMPDESRLPAIIVCESCRAADGTTGARLVADLVAALDEAGLVDALRVVGTDCLNGCGAPVALALSDARKAAYLFHRIEPAGDVADIVATARAWLAAEGGHIANATKCGRLRLCLAGRIPLV